MTNVPDPTAEPFDEHDIARFIADLPPPDQWRRDSSALRVEPLQDSSDLAGFNSWVVTLLSAAHQLILEGEDSTAFVTVAVLVAARQAHYFAPDDDETNHMFFRRLRREAQALDAEWFFIRMLTDVTIVAPFSYDGPGLCFYAERRGALARSGVICTHQPVVGVTLEGHPDHADQLFREVMA